MSSVNDVVEALCKRSPITVRGEGDMQLLGAELAGLLPMRSLVTLSGELGAGKSVLVRSAIHACGYTGRVKSPTYTLIETYECANDVGVTHVSGASDSTEGKQSGRRVAHLDLYRLTDPGELEYLGFDDVLETHDLVFIEWPEQGAQRLPVATLHVLIEYADNGARKVSFIDPAKNA